MVKIKSSMYGQDKSVTTLAVAECKQTEKCPNVSQGFLDQNNSNLLYHFPGLSDPCC